MKFEPRDYQLEGIEKFKVWWQGPDMEALIALTMGMGKTITAALCVSQFLENIKPTGSILWLTHREELIKQSLEELELYTGLPCEIEKATQKYTGSARIIVASVQTLRGKRLQNLHASFYPDLIICDEAHHALALTWMQIKQTFPKAKVLNLTATPFRSDIGNRLELGTVLLEKNTTDGIRMGILVPPKPVGKLEINLGTVKKRLGDYDVKSLAELLCKEEVLTGCLDLINQNCKNKKSILFAASVEHGKVISGKLREAGFKVGEVYGETPTVERQQYYDGISQGSLDIIVNNLCLDTETEVLTQTGWKNCNTISSEDYAANWHKGRIWFSKLKRIIKRKRKTDERMVRLDSRIRVTEGHRMLNRQSNGTYLHTESQILIGKNWEFPVSGNAEPANFPSENNTPSSNSASWIASAPDLNKATCNFIGDWLCNPSSLVPTYLAPYLTQTPNQLWWNFSAQQFDWVLAGYWLANENHGGPLPNWFELRSTKQAVLDQLQAIAVCRGYNTALRKGPCPRNSEKQQEWMLSLSKKDSVAVSQIFGCMEWDTEQIDEDVWCIETESTNIVTRRRGFVTIMGNCLTEGFNLPALEVVIMLRPTRNAALYLQCIGRGLRVDRNNPNKKHCYIIDILDTAKRKGGEACTMPTDDDVRMYSALNGRTASQVEVFLSWFYHAAELADLVAGTKSVKEINKLDTPDKVYKLLAPPWMAHLNVNPAADILSKVWTEDGTYKDLTNPFRIGNADAFRLMVGRKGWVYLPHNQLPQTEEQLEEYEVEALPPEAENNYTITTLISQDAQLKNFILDLFDPNQSLKEQASKCYDAYSFGNQGKEIMWFKLIHQVPNQFHFIQWKVDETNCILVRTPNGKIYFYQQEGRGKLEHKPAHTMIHKITGKPFGVSFDRLVQHLS